MMDMSWLILSLCFINFSFLFISCFLLEVWLGRFWNSMSNSVCCCTSDQSVYSRNAWKSSSSQCNRSWSFVFLTFFTFSEVSSLYYNSSFLECFVEHFFPCLLWNFLCLCEGVRGWGEEKGKSLSSWHSSHIILFFPFPYPKRFGCPKHGQLCCFPRSVEWLSTWLIFLSLGCMCWSRFPKSIEQDGSREYRFGTCPSLVISLFRLKRNEDWASLLLFQFCFIFPWKAIVVSPNLLELEASNPLLIISATQKLTAFVAQLIHWRANTRHNLHLT